MIVDTVYKRPETEFRNRKKPTKIFFEQMNDIEKHQKMIQIIKEFGKTTVYGNKSCLHPVQQVD